MRILVHHHQPSSTTIINPSFFYSTLPFTTHSILTTLSFPKTPKPTSKSCRSSYLSLLPQFRQTHLASCSKGGFFEDFNLTPWPEAPVSEETEELELHDKPSPKPVADEPGEEIEQAEPSEIDKDEVLEPFLKFFKPVEEESELEKNGSVSSVEEVNGRVSVEYYEPKPGDLVVGVVVSGNENRLDVNVGADMLGLMLTKEVLPLYDKEMDYLSCDLGKDGEEFFVRGKVGILRYDEAMGGEPMPGKPVVELGTILFAEVLGRTLGGRPLLSARRLFRRIAWHRVRQIMQLNEPIEVKITEWNNGGLITRLEGLRAFLPKAELLNRVNNFTELKENVGRKIHVHITRINEDTNDLILSEKEAWKLTHLQEGTLLKGTVQKIYPYGAQIRIGDTNRSGLLHISNISRARIASINDVLSVDEEVKALVVKSMFPDKISLSISELESEPGLFLSNKEKVFSEAEEMAKKYRQKIPLLVTKKLETPPMDGLPFGDDERLYSNWKWFKFERENKINT